MESWQLITDGTPRQFVDALVRESRAHAAVRHPYLEFLAKGELPDVPGALRDYAFQYSFYSAEFPSYVEGVIGGLQSPR
ncbi:MAG: hypothetical protein MJE66_07580, partial [Proteobacteria bacterium]|nr:hypothetical protein [Pseudomonadota bacterium]